MQLEAVGATAVLPRGAKTTSYLSENKENTAYTRKSIHHPPFGTTTLVHIAAALRTVLRVPFLLGVRTSVVHTETKQLSSSRSSQSTVRSAGDYVGAARSAAAAEAWRTDAYHRNPRWQETPTETPIANCETAQFRSSWMWCFSLGCADTETGWVAMPSSRVLADETYRRHEHQHRQLAAEHQRRSRRSSSKAAVAAHHAAREYGGAQQGKAYPSPRVSAAKHIAGWPTP